MTQLLSAREKLTALYSRYENICRPILKFLFALVTLGMINRSVGYSEALKSVPVVLVLALLCSFLPINFIVVIGALVVLLHLYALSLESVILVGVMFLIMFLLYFRFSSKDTVLLLLTPLCFLLKLPYVVPICAGLVAAPSAVVSTGCGVVTYYVLSYIAANRTALAAMEEESLLEKFRYLLMAMLGNKEMQVMVVAFAATILVVYVIRRLSVDHAWTIAMVTGMLVDILVVLVGDLKYATYISVPGLILGSLVALAVAVVLQFFIFNVDYSRTERVQFEDEEYYYYVKAVPKNVVPPAERTVKKIKGQEGKGSRPHGASKPTSSEKDAPEYRMRRLATREGDAGSGGATGGAASARVSSGRASAGDGARSSAGAGSRNKNRTKRIIVPEEQDGRGAGLERDDRLTGIERAAAAKARAARTAGTGRKPDGQE